MKIVKFGVKNFRAIGTGPNSEGVWLDLAASNLILLIGKNNTGKSSLLEAYDMFVKAERTAVESDFHNKDTKVPIEIEAWIKAETEEDKKHQAFAAWLDDDGIARIKKTWTKIDEAASKESYDPKQKKFVAGGAGGFDTILQNGCPSPVWIRGMTTPQEVIESLQKLVTATILKRVACCQISTNPARCLHV